MRYLYLCIYLVIEYVLIICSVPGTELDAMKIVGNTTRSYSRLQQSLLSHQFVGKSDFSD